MAVVNIVQGKLKGALTRTENGTSYFEFLNIPYASPPVGDKRFKSPQPAEPWQGEKDVSTGKDSKIAFQRNLSNEIVGAEDCLYLNVFTPQLPTSDKDVKLPVMVYIHGGGFILGNGTVKDEKGPQFLLEKNVVIVSINYRLHVFGFLTLDIPEVSGNMGLKDQNFALRWVQQNIETFGGDKNNVTIFGESAGAASAEYHILSTSSTGLFHKAILQSGSTLNHWACNYEPHKIVKYLLNELNYLGVFEDKKAIYDFLLRIDSRKLIEAAIKANTNLVKNRFYCGFVPTIEKVSHEDAFLTTPPYVALREGKFNKVPIIRGYCNREGFLMQIYKPHIIANTTSNKQRFNALEHWSYEVSSSDMDKYNMEFYESYFINNSLDRAAIDFFGDYDFVAGVNVAAKLMSNHKISQHVYEFSYDGNLNFLKILFNIKNEGACHADDLGYLFYNTVTAQLQITNTDKMVRNRMTKMWTNFAKFTDPTPATDDTITLRWPDYTKEAPSYLNIDANLKVISGGYEPRKMAVFEEIYEKYEM